MSWNFLLLIERFCKLTQQFYMTNIVECIMWVMNNAPMMRRIQQQMCVNGVYEKTKNCYKSIRANHKYIDKKSFCRNHLKSQFNCIFSLVICIWVILLLLMFWFSNTCRFRIGLTFTMNDLGTHLCLRRKGTEKDRPSEMK